MNSPIQPVRIDFLQQVAYSTAPYDPRPRPYLFVQLEAAGHRTGPILALVDSGADSSHFHIDIATFVLNLDFTGLDPIPSRGYGAGAPAYPAAVTIHLPELSFAADVRFSANVPMDQALLGRADFFRQVLVGFDEQRQLLLYTPY